MSETQKYKIVFVKEDSIEYYGEPGANTMHSIYLAEYIEKYFKEHPVLGRLTVATGADSLAYALTYFENMIIIMNETRIGPNGLPKYGTFVCLIMPPVVSEKLQHQLSLLHENLSHFNQVVIEQTVVENNYLTGNIVDVDDSLTVEGQIAQAIRKINGESEKKK